MEALRAAGRGDAGGRAQRRRRGRGGGRRRPTARASWRVFSLGRGRAAAPARPPELWERLGGDHGRACTSDGRRFARPPGFVRHAWDAEGMVGARPAVGRPVALGPWDAERGARRWRRPARRARAARRPAPHAGPLRPGARRPGLRQRRSSGADGTPVVIDFDDCGPAGTCGSWPWPCSRSTASRASTSVATRWCAATAAVAELPDDVLAELPTFVMARRIATLGWLFTAPRTRRTPRPSASGGCARCAGASRATWSGPAPRRPGTAHAAASALASGPGIIRRPVNGTGGGAVEGPGIEAYLDEMVDLFSTLHEKRRDPDVRARRPDRGQRAAAGRAAADPGVRHGLPRLRRRAAGGARRDAAVPLRPRHEHRRARALAVRGRRRSPPSDRSSGSAAPRAARRPPPARRSTATDSSSACSRRPRVGRARVRVAEQLARAPPSAR